MKKEVRTGRTGGPSEPNANARNGVQTPPAREMSLAKAKKLIRKTSILHEGLFRRLAK